MLFSAPDASGFHCRGKICPAPLAARPSWAGTDQNQELSGKKKKASKKRKQSAAFPAGRDHGRSPELCGSPAFSTSNPSPARSGIRRFKQLCSTPTILGPWGDFLGKPLAAPAPSRLSIYTKNQNRTRPRSPRTFPSAADPSAAGPGCSVNAEPALLVVLLG